MLLTITTTHAPATDLGYLLHKSPERVNSVELAFGTAHVFYPEASESRCTAALLFELDPIGLVRGRGRAVERRWALARARRRAHDRQRRVLRAHAQVPAGIHA